MPRREKPDKKGRMAEKERTNRTSYRVIYGDTDQMGVVYYANYLRWFEIGRTEFLREIGLPYVSVERQGIHFPVVEVSCRYHKPARYDDLIVVETALTAVARATLTFHYRILRKDSGLVIASGWTKHACINKKGEVTRMPAELEKSLRSIVSP